MKNHNFTFILVPFDVDEETVADLLYENGADDGLFGFSNGAYNIDFNRNNDSLEKAIMSAKADVEKSGTNVLEIILHVDDLLEIFKKKQ